MTIGLVFLSLLMVAIVGWLFRQTLNVQPWRAQAVPLPQHAIGAAARPAAKTGLWVFLAVASSLFVLFISAYAMRLSVGDWSPLPRPRLLVVNTAVLVAASLAMEWALQAARRGDAAGLRRRLGAGGALTWLFVAGQLGVWTQLVGAGHPLASSPASAFFYLLTGVHGVHVLGGLVAWARAMARTRPGRDPAAAAALAGLCATYWHFLLAVWLVLYALLVSSDLGLAVCSSAAPL